MAFAIVLAVGLAAVAFLLILVVGLIRHLKVLSRSLRQFQDEAQPVLLEIQRRSADAQERMRGLPERPGGRLRP